MTRVSLAEEYDNKDVLKQIFMLRDELDSLKRILQEKGIL